MISFDQFLQDLMKEDDQEKKQQDQTSTLTAPQPIAQQSESQSSTAQTRDQTTPFTTAAPDQAPSSGSDYDPFVASQTPTTQTGQTTLPDSSQVAPATVTPKAPGPITSKYTDEFVMPETGDYGYAPTYGYGSFVAGPEPSSTITYQTPTNLIIPGDTGISTMTGSTGIATSGAPTTTTTTTSSAPTQTTQPTQQTPLTSSASSGSSSDQTSGAQSGSQPTIPQVFNPLWDYLAQQAQAEKLREVPVPSSTNLSSTGTKAGLGRSIQKVLPTLENETGQIPAWLQQYLLMMQLGLVPPVSINAG